MIGVDYFIIGAVSAVVGYRVSLSTRRRLGVTPWRWPPILWAFICGASFIVGFILLVVLEPSEEAIALSGYIVLAAFGLVLIVVALIGTATSCRDRRARYTR